MRKLLSSGIGLLVAYIGLCGAVFLLQAMPFPGLFLMMLGGPLWIGIIIHIAMVHFVSASCGRYISPFWIALPIVYYAGGYALHVASVHQAEELAAAIEKSNAETVKVEQPIAFLADGEYFPSDLIAYYRVDRIFQRVSLYNKEQGAPFVAQFYARGEDCDHANQDRHFHANEDLHGQRVQQDLFPGLVPRQCIIAQRGLPPEWRYRLKEEKVADEGLVWRQGWRWTVYDDKAEGVQRLSVAAIDYAALPQVQTLVAGCALDSMRPAWRCGAGLIYSDSVMTAGYKQSSNRLDPGNNTYRVVTDLLARALSLEPRTN